MPGSVTDVRLIAGGHPITTVEDWFAFAPPRGGRQQWRAGRSAMELARAWCAGAGGPCVPAALAALLESHPDFRSAEIDEAVPEARQWFDDIGGEPRNADLAATGHAACGRFVLSVEAKADEPFGQLVSEVLEIAARKAAREVPTRAGERVLGLAAALLPPRSDSASLLGDLRYQLLTATAGALAHAGQVGAARAALVVHEFRSSETDDAKLADNERDLNQFIERLSQGRWRAVPGGELLGPVHVPGSPRIPSGVGLYIGKIRTDLLTDLARPRVADARM